MSDTEREQLVRWERRRKSSQALALRSRIVLKCAEGRANKEVAADCGVSAATVGKWRRRFGELRLDGLSEGVLEGVIRASSLMSRVWGRVVVRGG